MNAVYQDSSIISSIYKMDNVLYEIRDNRGILRNFEYEPWKAQVISDLESAGFIKAEGDKYIITEEGREVIRQDSLLYYDKNIKSSVLEVQEEVEPKRGNLLIPFLLAVSIVIFTAMAIYIWAPVK